MLKPIGNKILVELTDTVDNKTKSGFLIANPNNDSAIVENRGTIVSLGSGKDNQGQTAPDLGLEVGQTVIIGLYGASTINEEGQDYSSFPVGKAYKIIPPSEVVAVVDKE